jgi:hexosaminidase
MAATTRRKSAEERREEILYRARVAAEGPRWDAAGVAYTRSPQIDWPARRPSP